MSKQIAYRFFSPKSAPVYVSEVKGDGGVDWGYTNEIKKAVILNHNQWQSFAQELIVSELGMSLTKSRATKKNVSEKDAAAGIKAGNSARFDRPVGAGGRFYLK